MDPLLVSVEEAARALSIGRSAAYELIASRQLASVKIGRSRRVPVQALREYVERASRVQQMGTEATQAA